MKGERFLEALNYIDSKYIEEARCNKVKKRFNFKPIIAVAACAAFALAAVPLAKHFAGGFINNTEGTQTGATATTEAPIGASGKFTVLYAGSADSSSGIALEKETDFDGIDEYFTDKTKVGTKKTIIIAGVTYTGTYVDSTKSDYYGDDTDNYRAVNNKLVTFSINRKTGVCTNFFIGDSTPVTGKKLTSGEAYAKAIEHLKEYVNDIENYTLIDTFEQGGNLGYLFRLYRMVNGIKTSDCIDIRVNYAGEICRHSLYSIGEMKDVDISAVNTRNVNEAISDKVNIAYKEYLDVNYSTQKIMFARLANGKYTFIYDIAVSGKNGEKAFTNFDKIVVEIE